MVERTLNEEERIRRAEEIYYRRKNDGNKYSEYANLSIGNKKDFKLFKKMIIQIIACILIYLLFFTLQNSNYIFSEQFIGKTKEILAYDINFEELKNMALVLVDKLNIRENEVENNIIEEDTNIIENTENTDNVDNKENTEEAIVTDNSITDNTEDVLYKEEASSVSQVEEDATYIKNNFSLIKPLERDSNIKVWCT